MTIFKTSKEGAQALDREDVLSGFRQRFYLLPKKIYMDGNSLGLLSQDAEEGLHRMIDQWKRLGINGWLEAEPPWFGYAEELGKRQAVLVGALPEEVVMTSSTTVNLHALVGTFYHPQGKRKKILADELNFPSDIYALKSQIESKGYDLGRDLVLVKSRDGRMLEEEDIVRAMDDETALILLPGVLYRSGQLLDMAYLSKKAHEKGIPIGFDCSHSVGAVPHHFDRWDVDFAFWCNYKYMNNGPGGVASLFINKKHFSRKPSLAGWWGYRKDKQFNMSLDFEKANNAGGWQIGTPHLLSLAPLEGSLKIFHEAGMENVRKKSLKLTSYLIFLIKELGLTDSPYHFSIGSPLEEERRGGHVAIEHDDAARINKALKDRGIIPDFRYPNIIRLAPVALYNTFYEVWQVVEALKEIIEKGEHKKYGDVKEAVT